MAKASDYSIDYEDERLNDIKTEETKALTQNQMDYEGMIGDTDSYYQAQIDATKDWENKQSQIQQEQTDFTIEQIEQQKEQAQKDYTKEQAGAYVDWQKQSNQYGVEAEKIASSGLTNTGFSESSQVSMYNTYQNRVATARESYNQAVLNYNNAIKDARLQNNAALAEIAANALQQQLELSLQGFQYKNQLILDLSDKKLETQKFYADQWQNVLDQMNKENALAEEVRQFNENQEFQATQAELDRQWKTKEAELDREFQAAQAEIERKYKSAEAELDRKHDLALVEAKTKAEKELADHEHKLAMEKLKQQQAYELEQLDKQLANEKALAKYEYDLSNSAKFTTTKGSSSGSKTTTRAQQFLTQKQNVANTVKAQTTGKTTQATLNSISALGYGPITAAKLDSLVASGEVVEYVSNGVTLFRKGTPKLKTSSLISQSQKSALVSLPTSKLRN